MEKKDVRTQRLEEEELKSVNTLNAPIFTFQTYQTSQKELEKQLLFALGNSAICFYDT